MLTCGDRAKHRPETDRTVTGAATNGGFRQHASVLGNSPLSALSYQLYAYSSSLPYPLIKLPVAA